MTLPVLDIVFIIAALFFIIHGASKGFIDELFGIGSFVFSAFFAFKFMSKLEPYLASSMKQPIAKVLSFLIIFVAVFLVFKIVQTVLNSIFNSEIFKSLNRWLGLLVGVAEAVFCIFVILILLEALEPWIDTMPLRNSSFVYRFFNGFIGGHLPKGSAGILEHI